jgi:hypothetical protein
MDKYWTEFDISHARYIIIHNGRLQESWADALFVDKWYSVWRGKLKALTLIVNGNPVACIGIAVQEWNKAEAWALFAEGFEKYKLSIYRKIKESIIEAFKQNIIRIQATIDPINMRWIESLGFEYEGRLRKFGPSGEDYLMYSKIAEVT